MTRSPGHGAGAAWADVERELCDVILTAMVALASLTPDARKVFEEHVSSVADRSLG